MSVAKLAEAMREALRAPFYRDHLDEELRRISTWVRDVHEGRHRHALALVGNIGAGKTRILDHLRAGVRGWPREQRAFVHEVQLADTGFNRASAGALLLNALDKSMETIGHTDPKVPRSRPPSVLPIVWAIVHGDCFPDEVEGQVAVALRRARNSTETEKIRLCEDLSHWLRRQPLTPARTRASGLARTIDWEGELIPVLADLLRFAQACDHIKTLFFFIDQIEDLFTSSFTQVRRARILTDLRSLVDEADRGAPLGLILAWAPESDTKLNQKYEALANRLRRVRVELPLLAHAHAEGFTRVWIEALRGEPGWDPQRQPTASSLAEAAWDLLRANGQLLSPERSTPREFLAALAEEVERRARARSPAAPPPRPSR